MSERLNSLQGLRAIAFLMIFLGHCGIGSGAGFGVSIFLVLSGFLMVYNYYSKEVHVGIKQNILFSAKKIKKLYPLHILMTFPMILLFFLSAIKSGCVEKIFKLFPQLFSNIFLVQAWIPIREYYFAFNGVAWYLSVSAFLYFVFPFILKKIQLWSGLKPAFFLIGESTLVQMAVGLASEYMINKGININLSWLTYICPVYRIGDFLVGCCLGYIYLKRRNSIIQKNSISMVVLTIGEIIVIVIAVICYWLPVCFELPESTLLSLRYLPASSVIVLLVAIGGGYISKILSKKIVVELGNISGYTFLIHQVVINIVEILGLKGGWSVAFSSFIITLAIAYIYKNKILNSKRIYFIGNITSKNYF